MKVVVIGTGYVGLVTGACLSEYGLSVTCVDLDSDKISRLRKNEMPIYEPGLKEIVEKNQKAGRLSFEVNGERSISEADVVFLAVGTPPLPDGSADMKYVYEAVRTFSRNHRSYQVLVTKSTVPVGTGARLEEIMMENHSGDTFAVASNPEFLREGCAVADFMNPDRIVIGCNDPKGLKVLLDLYEPMRKANAPILVTDRASSELIKYASNAFLSVKISFVNELSRLAEKVGADIASVAQGMGMDKRIGPAFLLPGPGYGGSCFPKDTKALLDTSRAFGSPLRLVDAAEQANREQVEFAAGKVLAAAGGEKKTAALLGLAFKGGTDDVRESPALKIAEILMSKGIAVKAYDPEASANALREVPGLDVVGSAAEAAKDADMLVIATEWNEFKTLDLPRLKEIMKSPVIIDLRNLLDPNHCRELGFAYTGIGRA
ncbi:MAG TPA: UDP-glucose/GDP-mannose dehydrogenase family protein [Acidobacteriota bacterium]|nr:UDP-glucose/GDP-mannose dehydrogenase family protein [Acidobacteriota bacterium]HNT16606.1 UDP-glucose/GDP-mannose dehydrogenase family protein [Acidobacteriota bacterium]HPA26691.1 UDP-glucose/GDP-mannose dehydrogenase family protein [Acidobacteriota bacterium]HQO19951.1 UDP-glucose/GDP-mannose dehydrogenase family protein [Acidobacteriota bacterium]HQQ46790.1 UDP-glucose/GDP-mannose dehydrogenase family protein [Acidobacteriota bacterium]